MTQKGADEVLVKKSSFTDVCSLHRAAQMLLQNLCCLDDADVLKCKKIP